MISMMSRVMTWLTVSGVPSMKSRLMTSLAGTSSASANSPTVTPSVTVDGVAADRQVDVGRGLVVGGLLGLGADRLLVLLLLAAALDGRGGDRRLGLVEDLLTLQLLGLDGHLAVAVLFVLVELRGLLGLEAGALGCDGGFEAGASVGFARLAGRRRRLGDRRGRLGDHRARLGLLGGRRRTARLGGRTGAGLGDDGDRSGSSRTTGPALARPPRPATLRASSARARCSSSRRRRSSSVGLAALFLGGLAGGLFGRRCFAASAASRLALLLGERSLALGDLRAERLADLVHVGLDQRRCVVLGRDLQLLRACRAAPC